MRNGRTRQAPMSPQSNILRAKRLTCDHPLRVLKKPRRVKDEVLGWMVRKPEVIVGGAFVWQFCTRRLSAKLHSDTHARLIANLPKWENYEEKSPRASAITNK